MCSWVDGAGRLLLLWRYTILHQDTPLSTLLCLLSITRHKISFKTLKIRQLSQICFPSKTVSNKLGNTSFTPLRFTVREFLKTSFRYCVVLKLHYSRVTKFLFHSLLIFCEHFAYIFFYGLGYLNRSIWKLGWWIFFLLYPTHRWVGGRNLGS